MSEESHKTLFLNVENTGPSQMVGAFARRKGLQASSGATQPAQSVNSALVRGMAERAFEFSLKRPKVFTTAMIDEADLVIAMGHSIEKACPRPMLDTMQKMVIDWNLDDPKGESILEGRKIWNEIERRFEEPAKNRDLVSSL